MKRLFLLALVFLAGCDPMKEPEQVLTPAGTVHSVTVNYVGKRAYSQVLMTNGRSFVVAGVLQGAEGTAAHIKQKHIEELCAGVPVMCRQLVD